MFAGMEEGCIRLMNIFVRGCRPFEDDANFADLATMLRQN